MPLYKVRDGVSISGDLHPGAVFDTSDKLYQNHDIPFLLKRGDIVEATEDDKKAQAKLVETPGLAKRIADEQAAAVPVGLEGEAKPGAGDHDVAIQQSRGDVLQPAETVPPPTAPKAK